eukprot:TRINITY_DN2383_c0_g1_i1.p1 TRINITY_DN2383_c0_g1~~TRINITY_DN2383_c0_g1_i1.p1  ORF type:complete len:431 (-),score=129.65 TRINITY_DN2383_c0_g1_i1:14-1306(-)
MLASLFCSTLCVRWMFPLRIILSAQRNPTLISSLHPLPLFPSFLPFLLSSLSFSFFFLLHFPFSSEVLILYSPPFLPLSIPSDHVASLHCVPLRRVAVPDERFDWLVEHWKPKKNIPAYLTITDIAGLIKGAAEGEGLGNEFLSNIQAVDAIFHVVRIFDDDDVIHVENSIDPVRDLAIIREELMKKDMEWAMTEYEDVAKKCRDAKEGPKKEAFDMISKIVAHLEDDREIRFGDWSSKEVEYLNTLQFLTAKPVIYLLNLSVKHYVKKKNKWLAKVKQWVDEMSGNTEVIIPFSAELESGLLKAGDDEESKQAYLAELGKDVTSALPKIILSGYKALHLMHYFTTGEDEVKAWTVRVGSKAPQAAGAIHSDFCDFFIKAEVYSFDDMMEFGSERDVRAAGKLRMEGKNYVVKDGDIMFIKHNADKKKKK